MDGGWVGCCLNLPGSVYSSPQQSPFVPFWPTAQRPDCWGGKEGGRRGRSGHLVALTARIHFQRKRRLSQPNFILLDGIINIIWTQIYIALLQYLHKRFVKFGLIFFKCKIYNKTWIYYPWIHYTGYLQDKLFDFSTLERGLIYTESNGGLAFYLLPSQYMEANPFWQIKKTY